MEGHFWKQGLSFCLQSHHEDFDRQSIGSLLLLQLNKELGHTNAERTMVTVSVTPFSVNVCGGLGSPKGVPQGNGRVISCTRRLDLLGFVYELRTKDKGSGELLHMAHEESL